MAAFPTHPSLLAADFSASSVLGHACFSFDRQP